MPIKMLKIGTNELYNAYDFKQEDGIDKVLVYSPDFGWKWERLNDFQPLNSKEM